MRKQSSQYERTLVLLKPDAVQRGLIGEIITRFEKKGLKISAMRMVWPDKELAAKHYDQPESAMRQLGERTLESYREKGVTHRFSDPIDIAKDIQKKLVDYLTTGPVVAMIIEGAHAITFVRKIRGATNPQNADIGSITADYTIDSYFLADEDERSIRNLVHASGTVDEAETEISLWFGEDDIYDYHTAIDKVLYSKQWQEDDRETLRQKSLD